MPMGYRFALTFHILHRVWYKRHVFYVTLIFLFTNGSDYLRHWIFTHWTLVWFQLSPICHW